VRTPRRPGGFAGWRWELLGHLQGRVLEIETLKLGYYGLCKRMIAKSRMV
jgi:hypothetical protein